jgi:hypothetical protein
MKHLRVPKQSRAACGVKLAKGDKLVDAALSAECDACRTSVGIARKGDKLWEGQLPVGVREIPKWKPQPMAQAKELLASAKKNRA